jgi:hypothetical protein
MEYLSTKQVGQRIRRGSLPATATGVWRCPKHPERRLGTTDMLQWPKGSTACGSNCPPSHVVFDSLGITVDLDA